MEQVVPPQESQEMPNKTTGQRDHLAEWPWAQHSNISNLSLLTNKMSSLFEPFNALKFYDL